METGGGLEFFPPIRCIPYGKGNAAPVLAGQSVAGPHQGNFRMLPQKGELSAQFLRQPLVVRVEEGNELALCHWQDGITGRSGTLVGRQADHLRGRHEFEDFFRRSVRGCIISDKHLQITDSLGADACKSPADAVGTIVSRDDDADQHDIAGSMKNTPKPWPSFLRWHALSVIFRRKTMPNRLHRTMLYFGNNKALSAALVMAVALSLVGSNWGRVECWNMDNMAFHGVRANGLPHDYLKPPLHTYLNHILVLKPVEACRAVMGMEHNAQYPFQLAGTRLLTLALFCGMIIILYRTVNCLSGMTAAGLIALLAATSAGLIKFNHFATADSPLLFWMVASFAMALRAALSGKLPEALFAGVLAGLAAANKYNGLGVAIAIPAGLLVTRGWKGMIGILSWIGAAGLVLGFIIGNPGALFDTRNFVQDFLYNLYTTPVYTGQTSGSGYADFLLAFPELIGWPGTLLVLIAVAGTLILAVLKKFSHRELLLITAAGAVFVFYFITIGRFPRMADRFVLPAVPFVLFLAAPTLGRIPWRRPIPLAVILGVLAYNLLCSSLLDLRFLSDPRLEAQVFVMREFPRNATIENSYAPRWQFLPGLKVRVHEMPNATGRSGLFTKIFPSSNVIHKGIEKFESTKYSADTFTPEGLARRNPDYVAFSNQVFDFTGDETAQRFYSGLESEKLGYKKVFEQTCMPRVPWTYPTCIDFLVDRMIILKRKPH